MAQAPVVPPSHTNEHPETTRSGAAADETATCHDRQRRNPHALEQVHDHTQPQHQGSRLLAQNEPEVSDAGRRELARSLFGEPLSRTQLDRLMSAEQKQVCKRNKAHLHTFRRPQSLLTTSVPQEPNLCLCVQSEQQFTDKWNFDVVKERPVSGRWTYDPASKQ